MKKCNKNILIFLISFICIVISIKSVDAKEHEPIRVGYTNIKGFIEKNDDTYTGYLYDYLREISIYTGWEYEFIEMDIGTALEALQNGDIDLMGSMILNEHTIKNFDFATYDMGYTYNNLVIAHDNKAYELSKYIVLDGIKVGYIKTAKRTLDSFLEFCDSNGIKNVDLIPFDPLEGEKGLAEKLNNGEVDAIIGGDLTLNDTYGNIIAKFGATPYYFATTKGNTEIIKELNRALINIKEKDKLFEKSLYERHFNSNEMEYLILSKEEEAYIKKGEIIKVAYLTDSIPFQYYDKKRQGPDGVLVEYIKKLAEKININLQFIPISSCEEGYQLLRDQEVDLMLGAMDSFQNADKYNFHLTRNVLRVELDEIVNKDYIQHLNEGERKKIKALSGVQQEVEQWKDYETIHASSVEESIKMVNKGQADVTYTNPYAVNYYTSIGFYENIIVNKSQVPIDLAIGVSKNVDKNFLSILNKSLYSLKQSEAINIINEKIMGLQKDLRFKTFIQANIEVVIFSTVIGIAVIGTIITVMIKRKFNRMKEAKRILFEKTQLDPLTGIYNREACERLVKEYLETKPSYSYAVLAIIDIDHFKQVNDKFGHKVGDNLLIEFSSVLHQFFAHKDIVSRLGGDEFIIFMTDIEKQDITKIQEKLEELCTLMHREVEYNGDTQEISLSIGAVITREDKDFNTLYMSADEMLYEVKRNGRNGFKIKDVL
nr:GGDEF domain-containing protein [uncultured Niameybacter sp.]